MKEGRPGGIPSPCSSKRWERLDWGSGNGHTVQWTNLEMVKEGKWRRFGQSWYTKDSGNRSGGWLWKLPPSRALSSKWKGSICYTRKKNVGKEMSNRCLFLRKKFSRIEGWENHSGLYMIESETVEVYVAQSCLTICHPMNYTVHGILQARILEWVTFPFSRGSSQHRDRTQVSYIACRFFTSWATREAQEYWSR